MGSGDGRQLAAYGDLGDVRVWDLRRATSLSTMAKLAQKGTELLRIQPDNPFGLWALGEWYAYRGAWDLAANLLETARAGGEQSDRQLLARAYLETFRPRDAMREFEAELAELKRSPRDETSEAAADRLMRERHLEMCIESIRASLEQASQNPGSATAQEIQEDRVEAPPPGHAAGGVSPKSEASEPAKSD